MCWLVCCFMLIGSLFEKLADGKEKAISGYTFSKRSSTAYNKAVIDRRLRTLCCHIWGTAHVIFLSLYTQGYYVQA